MYFIYFIFLRKMPKVIDIDVREIVLKVREYFIKEKKQLEPIPFQKVNERIAAATGLSLRTISRIANEKDMPEASVNKKVKRKKYKINKSKHSLVNEKVKKKTAKDLVAVVYLDERNSDRVGPDLTEEYLKKDKEKDGASDPITDDQSYQKDQIVSAVLISGESSSAENSMIFRTEVTIETTTNT